MDELLSSLVYRHPVIWDRKHGDFKNKTKRYHAFTTIAKEMRSTPQMVENRYWALREKYRKEKIKLKNATENNRSIEPWPPMKYLSFLDSVMVTRRSGNTWGEFFETTSQLTKESKFSDLESFTTYQQSQSEVQDPEVESSLCHHTYFEPEVSVPPSTQSPNNDDADGELISSKMAGECVQKWKRKWEDVDEAEESTSRPFTDGVESLMQETTETPNKYAHFVNFVAESIRELDDGLKDEFVFQVHKLLYEIKKK